MKYFYYFNRKYKIDDNQNIYRCEYTDVRLQKYNNKVVKLKRINKEKLIKCYIDKDGYANITLHCNNKSRNYKLHHIIYMVYNLNIQNINNTTIQYDFNKNQFYQINHIDGNKLNNNPQNLEMVTLQENIKHAVEHKLHNSQTKAKYIDIYKNDEYVTTVWKLKGLAKYLDDLFGKQINRGTLWKWINNKKEYRGYTFQWKCNDYRKL